MKTLRIRIALGLLYALAAGADAVWPLLAKVGG